MLLWALWPVFIKRIGKLRWELSFYDFLIGAAIAVWAAGFTLGSIGTDITFRDNISIVGLRQLAYAGLAGGVFGLGVIMFVAAVAVTGAAVAGTLTGAIALVTGTLLAYFFAPGVSTGVQFAGVAIALVVFAVVARFHAEAERLKKKDAMHKTPMRRKVEAVAPGVTWALCIIGGVGIGAFLPFIDWARDFELQLTAYPIAAMFSLGMLAAGFVLNLYFLNLPLQGDPVSPLSYVKIPPAMHLTGLLGGFVFGAALLTYMMVVDAPVAVGSPRGVLVALVPAGMGLFAVLGRGVWKEYEEAIYRTKTLFLASGLGIIAASLAVVAGYV
jgi:glucose uptake protein